MTQPVSPASDAPWIVQKYGGTSVGKFIATIVDTIAPFYLLNNRLVIVCSARSGKTKALGTTNLLLQASREAVSRSSPQSSAAPTPLSSSFHGSTSGSLSSSQLTARLETKAAFHDTVDKLLEDHLEAARIAVPNNPDMLEQLEKEITDECDGLREFLQAAQIIHEVSSRSRDMIMGLGERLACRLVSTALKARGIESTLVTLETIVDELDDEVVRPPQNSYESTSYLGQPFYDALSEALAARIKNCKGVPVVTGYFGNVPGSLLSQVGRGYSDLCAALCAVGLQATELQIWKEVDGVFTADPRKVPTARLVPAITPEEAAELTYYGSEVIHPFTMEQAIKKSVPIRIKNVENPTGAGTVIFPDHTTQSKEDDIIRDPFMDGHVNQPEPPKSGMATPVGNNPKDSRKMPTAVTIKDNIIVLNVHSNRKTISHSFFARIFGTLNRYGVVVDLISTSEVHVSMAMTAEISARTLERLSADLEHVGTVSVLRDMVILSLVGKEMRHMVGVAGRMFSTLAEGNVNIEMISQGANEINISCVIHEGSALKALNLIHYSILELSPKPANMEGGTFGRSFF
ncbi:Aspartokinase [Malassezia pachydermatis]|uniref:aspartate kinase n=1 Tax=Malassezia pachydermatis TaxID=77020 RepID=A0A0M9VN14_9BASI|nr:aspartate kinase [Malassezia pachydermatis]KOS12869.1 aspartate kinase [Malassezia pachydermatis]